MESRNKKCQNLSKNKVVKPWKMWMHALERTPLVVVRTRVQQAICTALAARTVHFPAKRKWLRGSPKHANWSRFLILQQITLIKFLPALEWSNSVWSLMLQCTHRYISMKHYASAARNSVLLISCTHDLLTCEYVSGKERRQTSAWNEMICSSCGYEELKNNGTQFSRQANRSSPENVLHNEAMLWHTNDSSPLMMSCPL